MSEVDRFVADLERELREKKLTMLDSEILAALEGKQATREQICEWAKVFYAATRHGRMSIGNFYANAPDDDELRRELAENIYEEETGRISGVGMCHMDVFQFLLDEFGITREQAKRIPSPHGDHMPQGSPIPPEDYYVALATYGFSVEIPNAEWSERMARALRENYGFSDRSVRWFTMHAELDADHGEEFRGHAQKVAGQPGGLEALRARTLAFAPLIKNIWNGYGTWKSAAS
jgi:pyrroloquinoline quinone (PQQ) biosynthesis protein C